MTREDAEMLMEELLDDCYNYEVVHPGNKEMLKAYKTSKEKVIQLLMKVNEE